MLLVFAWGAKLVGRDAQLRCGMLCFGGWGQGRPAVVVVVTRAVAEGEEFLVDYGPAFWPPATHAAAADAAAADAAADAAAVSSA